MNLFYFYSRAKGNLATAKKKKGKKRLPNNGFERIRYINQLLMKQNKDKTVTEPAFTGS